MHHFRLQLVHYYHSLTGFGYIECGPGFTSKLEGMFKDIDISRDLMSNFKVSAIFLNAKRTMIDCTSEKLNNADPYRTTNHTMISRTCKFMSTF